MEFIKLLSIELHHEYFDGLCPDLSLFALESTDNTLRAGDIRIMQGGGKITLYCASLDGSTASKPLSGKLLRFAIMASNPNFNLYTDLTLSSRQLLVHNNQGTPTALGSPIVRQRISEFYRYTLQSANRPVTVSLKDDAGVVIDSLSVTDDHPSDDVTWHMRKYASGYYQVVESDGGSEVTTDIAYLPALPARAFGVVDLQLEPSIYSATPTFRIDYNAKSDRLNYYIVAKNYLANDLDNLSLNDSGFTLQARSKIEFTKREANQFTSDEVAPDLLTSPDSQVLLFTSQTDVARKQRGPVNLQLLLNNEVLISSLPTPASSSVKADFFIHVAKP